MSSSKSHATLGLLAALLAACPNSGDDDSSGATTASTDEVTSSASTSAGDTSASTTAAPTSAAPTTGTTTNADTTAADTTVGETTTGTTGQLHDVPGGVFLWTGAGGGGPETDLYVADVLARLVDAGVDADEGASLPVDLAERFGTLVYMNPTDTFPAPVDAAAAMLVANGGRIVLVMEHCKNGCWGNAEGHNTLLGALGAGMRLAGDGGADLESTPLDITAAPPVTDGVNSLVAFYSGHVIPGPATIPVGQISGGDVVVALEPVMAGEVLAITDASMLGYVLDEGDNGRLVTNLALH